MKIAVRKKRRKEIAKPLRQWIACIHLNGLPHCEKCNPIYRDYLHRAKKADV